MKREEIEKLLKDGGLSEDKIKATVDAIMDENGKDIESEKSKTTAKEAELTAANLTIENLQGKIKDFDGVDPKKLQEDAAALQVKYDTDMAAAKAESEKLKKEFGLRESLKDMGITDPDYLIFKHGGVEKFTFDDDGKPAGLEDVLKPYKETVPYIFKVETKPQHTFKGFKPGESRDGLPDSNKPTSLAEAVEMAIGGNGE